MEHQSQSHKILTRFLLSQLQATHRPSTQDLNPPPPYSYHHTDTTQNFEEDSDSDSEAPLPPPITIKISTPITIAGTSNLILLPTTTTLSTSTGPGTSPATNLAAAVLEALRKVKGEEGGIPMMDGYGNLRPVTVEIDAGIRIEGKGNVVGVGVGLKRGSLGKGRNDFAAMKPQGSEKEEGTPNEGRRGRTEFVSDKGVLKRKRRASSAPVGESGGKRERIE